MVWALSLLAVKLIPHGLSPMLRIFEKTPPEEGDGIWSLIGFGKRVSPLAHSVLYPRLRPHEAIPKYVSTRTSYHPV